MARKPIGVQKVASPLKPEQLVREGEPDLIDEGWLLHVATPVGTGHTVVHFLA